jgi:hypothetical protein
MIKKYYRWLAKWRFVHRYAYLIEVNNLLEDYITKSLLEGGSPEFLDKGRKDLVSTQQDTKQKESFINFIKNS